MDRKEVLDSVAENVESGNLIKHMLATEVVMRALARRLGEDEAEWGLTGLLHDKLEDISPEDFPWDVWVELEKEFEDLLTRIDPKEEWFLMERLDLLKKERRDQTYCQYVGRMLGQPKQTPDRIGCRIAMGPRRLLLCP